MIVRSELAGVLIALIGTPIASAMTLPSFHVLTGAAPMGDWTTDFPDERRRLPIPAGQSSMGCSAAPHRNLTFVHRLVDERPCRKDKRQPTTDPLIRELAVPTLKRHKSI